MCVWSVEGKRVGGGGGALLTLPPSNLMATETSAMRTDKS